jgi:hypothetical protein
MLPDVAGKGQFSELTAILLPFTSMTRRMRR